MKKVLLFVAVFILILFGAPYITGKVAETQIHALVTQLTTQNGSIDIVSYERGFKQTSSVYTYNLALEHQIKLGGLTSIDFHCDIQHGIIGVNHQCNITNNEWYSNLKDEHFNGNDPITILGAANILGTITQTITIDEINDFKFESDNTSIGIAKTELTVTTDKDLSHYDIDGESPKIIITSGTEEISLINADLIGNIVQLEKGILTGGFNFSAENINLKDINNTVNIDTLISTTSAKLNGQNIDSSTEISIDSMTLANAPFDVANELKFIATVNGVNKEALVEYQDFTNDLQNQLANTNGNTPTVDPMEMVPIFERMLTEDFNLSFGVSGKLDNHANSISFNFSILESLIFNDVMALTYDPQETLNKININITADFSQETVNQDPKLAASVLDSPLFEQQNNIYKMNLVLGPEIRLNDKPTTVQEIQNVISSNVGQQQN